MNIETIIAYWRARYQYALGLAHRSRGNRIPSLPAYHDAIEAFTHAIELQPTYAAPYLARGIIYWRELNDHTRAVRDCTQAITLEPHNADAYLNRGLARVYGAIGSRAEAIADFERYLALGKTGYWRIEAQNQIAQLSNALHPTSDL